MVTENNSIFRNLKFFLPFAFKNHPSYFFLNFFKVIINSLLPLVNILYSKLIIEELFGFRNTNTLVYYISIIVLSNVLGNYMIYIIQMHIRLINNKISNELDVLLNSKAMRMHYEYCEDPVLNDLLERANRGIHNYTNGIAGTVDFFGSVVSNAITFAGVIVILVQSKVPMLIVLATFGVLLSFIFSALGNKIEYNFNDSMIRINRHFIYLYFTLVSFKNGKDIRLYHAQDMIRDICEENNEKMSSEWRKMTNKYMFIGFFWVLYSFLAKRLLSYIILIYAYSNGLITIPELTALIASVEVFSSSMSVIISSLQKLKQYAKYQNKYIDFIEYPFKLKVGNVIPDQTIEKIEFKNVSFKYPNSEEFVLQNINLTINSLEKISIVGLNGAGKTTLIKLLCRLYDVTEGEILVNDINIKEYDYDEYLKLFSVVFQDFTVISFTVKENIEISENDSEKLYDSFEKAGIAERIISLPKKELTYINKWFDAEGVEFSGGEMQKLALARALYKDGAIVILDEPTAALDPVAEADLYMRFNSIITNKPTIFISHRLSSCKFADRIVVLDDKRIIEEGTHVELMNIPDGVYQKMFNIQAQYYQD